MNDPLPFRICRRANVPAKPAPLHKMPSCATSEPRLSKLQASLCDDGGGAAGERGLFSQHLLRDGR